jgi:DNA-binding transcriptional MerR regulator
MKIKQACNKTNLTERTIRFYIEKELIQPRADEVNGRMNYEFSSGDVDMLAKIAALRKTGFTIEDILRMQNAPEKTNLILKAHIDKLKNDSKCLLEVIGILDSLRNSTFQSMDDLGGAIHKSAGKLPLPAIDIQPNFSRFDNITKDEQQKALSEFEAEQKRSYALGRTIVFAIAGLNIAASIVSFIINLNFINLILSVILSGALLLGVSWVRYLFAIGSALSAVMLMVLLFGAGGISSLPVIGVVVLVAYLAFSVASCIVLFKSRSVSDFLYVQKNG